MRRLARLAIFVLAVAGATASIAIGWLMTQDISARRPPGQIETTIARRLRAAAIPRASRRVVNPVPVSPESLKKGLEHFADHCAMCHANDGSGATEMGRGLYPRVPDMRLPATQSLTDGELFYIIENGVRLTGMPAWGTGTPDGEEATWHLVGFIRRLPVLTAQEIEEMQTLNPKTVEEFRQEEEERKFLTGEPDTPKPMPGPTHKHGARK